ncbi:CreA family protein [Acetobacteraceae bacterium KSS8]|uniref:CreA family protein n=1 Tax=Endosaccharibacter trunci TaxID=2812733 RepID=A0ABT1W9K0_9PROT|nr:CreA family protein [Acetobacteraceae bacterium KSS8]
MTKTALALAACLIALPAWAQMRIGSVDTTFRVLGRNDRIAVDRYDDPDVPGISCYLSHAETGGVKGSLGVAADPSRFSLACQNSGHAAAPASLPANAVVFGVRSSLLFKELRVSRLFDRDRNVLVYLAWSTRSLTPGGSPANAISTVSLSGN